MKRKTKRAKKTEVPVPSAYADPASHISALLMWIVALDDETRRRLFFKLQRRYDFETGVWILPEKPEPPKNYCAICGKPQATPPNGIVTCAAGHSNVRGVTLEQAIALTKKTARRGR